MAGMPPVAANFGVGSWIERRARIAPDRVALVSDDRSFTYAELARRVRRLANGLRQLGVGRGDRVAWLGPNHPAFLESLFAAGLVGAALAPVNHRLAADGIRAVLADIEPRVLVHHAATDPTPAPDSVRHRAPSLGRSTGRWTLRRSWPRVPRTRSGWRWAWTRSACCRIPRAPPAAQGSC
jgi:acyl-CoA synthetase (AMP-forming)/AMP-acid ligase II